MNLDRWRWLMLSTAVVVAAAAVVVVVTRPGMPTTAGHPHDEFPSSDPGELAVAVPGFDLAVGDPQRFVLALFAADRRDVGYGSVTLRFRWLGEDVVTEPDAPFGYETTAMFALLPGTTERPPRDSPALLEPDEGRGVYVGQVAFDRSGLWEIEVTGAVWGSDAATGTGAFDVLARHQVPAVGEQALRSDNATLSTPGVGLDSIDSRAHLSGGVPDTALHQRSIRAAIDEQRPAVVVFSTPTYCLSRFCGPVTDMVASLEPRYRDRAEFIHVEVWENFDEQRLNPAASDWLLRDGNIQEPWVFLIAADGTIIARWDNVLIPSELEAALDLLPPGAVDR